MFEQSALHGILYRSEKQERSIASQTVSLSDMTFGPMRSIYIYPHSDQEFLVYHYRDRHGIIIKVCKLDNVHSCKKLIPRNNFQRNFKHGFTKKISFFITMDRPSGKTHGQVTAFLMRIMCKIYQPLPVTIFQTFKQWNCH